MRGCTRARRDALRAVDGELPLEQRFALDAHLERCPACHAWFERAQRLEELLVAQPEAPNADAERGLEGIQRALAEAPVQEAPAVPEPSSARQRPRRATWAAAAGIALAFVAWRTLAPADGDPFEATAEDVAREQLAPEAPTVTAAALADVAASVPLPEPRTPAEVRRELAGWIVEHLGPRVDGALEPTALDDAALRRRLRHWPLVRLAEDLLLDEDPLVARTAARYLGLRGDRVSVSRLTAARTRPGIGAAVVRALGDLGDAGVAPLGEMLLDPEHGELALTVLARQGSHAAAARIEAALVARLHARGETPGAASEEERVAHIDALWNAFETLGAPSVASLLRLAAAAPPGDPERRVKALNRMARLEGGGSELVRLVEERAPSLATVDTALLLEAAGRLMPDELLTWVADRAAEHRTRALALRVLGNWRGPAPVATLLALDAAGRVSEEDRVRTMRRLAAGGEERLVAFAESLVATGDALALGRYLELLVASEHPAVGSAVLALALTDALAEDERQWAALAVGELGEPRHGRVLVGVVARRLADPASSRRFLAACLLAIQALLGDEGVAEALLPLRPPAVRGVLAVLPERVTPSRMALEPQGPDLGDRAAVTLFRVARALGQARAAEPSDHVD